MRFSVRCNNDLSVDACVRLARAAEAAGFDQFWVSHDLFLRSAPVLLAAAATATERIELGTAILNPYTLDPSEIAMAAASLDELSGGRFNLGLAAGARGFLEWIGLEQREPLAAIRETVDAVRRLLAGERAPLRGRRLRWTEAAYLRFAPRRVCPIYLGAMGPRMLRLAGEIADGVLPLLFPPEHYFTVRPLVEEGRARRAEAKGPFDFVACVWVSVDADRAAARRALAERVAYYGPSLGPLILARLGLRAEDFEPIDRAMTLEADAAKAVSLVDDRMLAVGVVGGAAEVVERLAPLVRAGVRHVSFGPPLGPRPVEAVRLLGAEVVPALRAVAAPVG